ncbi:hypothetical protein LNS06_004244 [Salmonella enterica]|nr:hypothetical protein [Salmonella enterica]
MTHDQIVAMVGKYNIKADRAVSYNFDKYGSTQVEIREVDGGSLIWRAWSYESNFENVLESALDHSGTLKTADEIAEQEARATYAATGAATLNNDKTATRIKIKTVAGMTLIAKTEDVIFSDSGLFCSAWLMRLDLLENKTYAQAVTTSQIKTVEFIK